MPIYCCFLVHSDDSELDNNAAAVLVRGLRLHHAGPQGGTVRRHFQGLQVEDQSGYRCAYHSL